jgi:amino acid transporter
MDRVSGPSSPGLAREAIGLREVFFQSVTHMAPAAAVAFSIIVGANFAGGALPLSVIFALIGCLLVALSIGQLAKHLPSAGGFYTYTARGLHPYVGFMVAWAYAFVEPLIAPALYLIFGNVVAGMLAAEFGWTFSQWWWVAAVIFQLVIGVGVSIWLGAQYDPFTGFAILGTIIGAVVIAIYMTVNLSCLLFYLREHPGDFNLFLHGVIPVLGIFAFVPALMTATGVGSAVFDFISPLPHPFSVVGPVVAIMLFLGVVYLIYLVFTAPDRLRDTAKVFIDEEVAEVSTPI